MNTDAVTPSIGLIVIGDEILSGRRVDQHLPKAIALLTERGLSLDWAHYIGDDPVRIEGTLREAFATHAIVLCTGGIGATPDDCTRQAAAAALGVPLRLHPEAMRLIQQRQQAVAEERGQPWEPERADNLQRLKMGEFPAGASIVPNPYNQIPGFACRGPGGGTVYFMPGFPVMAWPMMAWVLDTEPALSARGSGWREHSVIVFDVAESVLTPYLERVQRRHPRTKIFSLPSVDHPDYGPHIDLGVRGPVELADIAFNHLLEVLTPLQLRYGPQRVRP